MFSRGIMAMRGFDEQFRCYSITTQCSADRQQLLNYAGKIIMPQSALAKLSALHIEYPMLFELHNDSCEAVTHAGVLEFTAQEGKVYIPQWMMRQLELSEGDLIRIASTTLPLGTFVKIQPQSPAFLDITDPKAVLENALRQYAALTEGDIIAIRYNGKVYELQCLEVKPDSNVNRGITIIETDLGVDFAPPVGYVDPYSSSYSRTRQDSTAAASHISSEMSVEEHKVIDSTRKWQAFAGTGQRLSGKSLQAKSAISTTNTTTAASETTDKQQNENKVPDAIRLPPNKLWFGYQVSQQTPIGDKETPPPFQGPGKSLRK